MATPTYNRAETLPITSFLVSQLAWTLFCSFTLFDHNLVGGNSSIIPIGDAR